MIDVTTQQRTVQTMPSHLRETVIAVFVSGSLAFGAAWMANANAVTTIETKQAVLIATVNKQEDLLAEQDKRFYEMLLQMERNTINQRHTNDRLEELATSIGSLVATINVNRGANATTQ